MPKTKVMAPGGHEFVVDEKYGGLEEPDTQDYHSGPYCALCHAHECTMCKPEFYEEPCPKKAVATLPGLEYD